jgi:adenylate kinase
MEFAVFLGLPGTGKGTQCAFLKNDIGALCLSPGEIIRAKLASNDDDVKDLSSMINSGQLLSDDFIMKLVENNIKSVIIDQKDKKLLIFDGIPRTIAQAKMLDELLMKNFNKKIKFVICLNVKKRVILKRLQSRVVCVSCGAPSNILHSKNFVCKCGSLSFVRRKDDEESIIRKRLANDKKNISLIYDYYLNSEVKCCNLDGNSNQKSVYKKLRNILFSNIV